MWLFSFPLFLCLLITYGSDFLLPKRFVLRNFLQPLNSCYEGAAQLKDILLVLSGYFILEILLFTIAYRRNRDIIWFYLVTKVNILFGWDSFTLYSRYYVFLFLLITQDLWFKKHFLRQNICYAYYACICAWCCHNRFFYQSSYYGTYKK